MFCFSPVLWSVTHHLLHIGLKVLIEMCCELLSMLNTILALLILFFMLASVALLACTTLLMYVNPSTSSGAVLCIRIGLLVLERMFTTCLCCIGCNTNFWYSLWAYLSSPPFVSASYVIYKVKDIHLLSHFPMNPIFFSLRLSPSSSSQLPGGTWMVKVYTSLLDAYFDSKALGELMCHSVFLSKLSHAFSKVMKLIYRNAFHSVDCCMVLLCGLCMSNPSWIIYFVIYVTVTGGLFRTSLSWTTTLTWWRHLCRVLINVNSSMPKRKLLHALFI